MVTSAPVVASGAPSVLSPVAAAVVTTAVGAGGVAAPLITPAGARPVNGAGNQQVQAPVQSLGDISDETIVLDISAREVTIDVDNAATWQLTIANGGNLVARFEVHVEGWVDGSWVTIEPGFVNLFEGGRGLVNVSITPPRRPPAAPVCTNWRLSSPHPTIRGCVRNGRLRWSSTLIMNSLSVTLARANRALIISGARAIYAFLCKTVATARLSSAWKGRMTKT